MADKEMMVVASKVKAYIKSKGGMNTSSSVSEVLSEKIMALCDQAIENAKKAKRKTVMDKDL